MQNSIILKATLKMKEKCIDDLGKIWVILGAKIKKINWMCLKMKKKWNFYFGNSLANTTVLGDLSLKKDEYLRKKKKNF